MPTNLPGARGVDDRRVLSGIVHVLKTGMRWRDCPAAYGPATTIYNRSNRWSRGGFWLAMLGALARAGWVAETAALDSSYARAHRCTHGGRGAGTQAIGPSRGGRMTKVHRLTDVIGRPAVVHLSYLPPYSPDLNPIEMAFAKLKALLRQEPACTIDGLVARIRQILDHVRPSECARFFHATGYQHST